MVRLRSFAFAMFMASPSPFAMATNTMCDFAGEDQSTHYAFEFIGYGEITMVQVNAPRHMRLGEYTARDFDYKDRRIDLVHAGPAGDGVLPPFTLKGRGDEVRLTIEGREIDGALTCQWQFDGAAGS